MLIAYPLLPHYRYDVFRALEHDDRLIIDFAADENYAGGTIPTIPFTRLTRVHHLRNIRIGRFLWQSGLVSRVASRRYGVIICVGDASYLSTWLSALLARMLRIPVLFWTIGWHRPEASMRRIARLCFYRLADQLLLYGDVGLAIGAQLGYPSERMTVIRNSSSDPIPGTRTPDIAVE